MNQARLGDLCQIRSGGTPSRDVPEYFGGEIPWAKIDDLNTDSGVVTETVEGITQRGLDAIRGRIFPEGTLLFAMYGSVGKIAWAGCELSTNQAILGIEVEDSLTLDRHYLYRWLQSQRSRFESEASGVTQKNLSAGYVRDQLIPLPPIHLQRRIAVILDKADGIQKKRRQALMLADDFLRSIFLDMFGDPTTNPKGFPIQPLGNLSEVRTGATPSRDRPDYYGGDIPWVKTGEVDEDLIVDAEERITASAIAETNCKVFPVGTILIAMYGQGKTRGKCGVLGIPAATNQACAAVMPTDSISNSYLFYLLRASYETIRAMARGGNQENLNLGMIKNIGIPIPPSPLQNRFSDIAMAVSRNKAHQKSSLQEAMSLFASVSASAFNGKI